MNDVAFVKVARSCRTRLLPVVVCLLLAGCPGARRVADAGRDRAASGATPVGVGAVDLSDPVRPTAVRAPLQLAAARNEWTSFVLELRGVAPGLSLRVSPTGTGSSAFDAANLQAYQVLPMPVEANPDYVRHTGSGATGRTLPRALFPLQIAGASVPLASLRDPARPTDPGAHAAASGGAVLLWLDVHVPGDAPAGPHAAAFQLMDGGGRAVGESIPVRLTVYDFALPAERHLQLVGRLDWPRLAALYPDGFGETVAPSLINRRESRYAKTVRVLDQLMTAAHQDRTTLEVPGLRPTVKWPGSGAAPEIDWREFDALATPWLGGDMFADRVPARYWPLPAAQNLDRRDPRARLDYWRTAATHFEQMGWIDSTAVALPPAPSPDADATLQSQAVDILEANPRLRVIVPLRDDQLAASPAIPPAATARLVTAAPGLISAAARPSAIGGADARTRPHWLAAGSSAAPPNSAAGAADDERDVRAWAWLAFLRQAELLTVGPALPETASASHPADAAAFTWFYPGSWFGIDQPLPTIQLKWLRHAQEDYEYLWMTRDRGELIGALQMARLITKPVEIPPGQPADPAFALMSGTPDPAAWDRARALLAENILLRKPGEPADPDRQRAVYIKTLQWAEPQERPVLIARSARWTIDPPDATPADDAAAPRPTAATRGTWVTLNFGIDVYNASDTTPYKNLLRWDAAVPGAGWQIRPEPPVEVPRLQTYHVEPASISARFNLDRVSAAALEPLGLTFVNGFTSRAYPFQARLPVAAIDRHDGAPTINASLDDWSESNAIQSGPLVLMMNRPALQQARLQPTPVNARVYGSWTPDNLHLAFALEGLGPRDAHFAHNDVYYQSRRAWGEDLAEALIQPVFADNTTGPVLHVVFKPNGALWVERKPAGAGGGDDDAWLPVEGAGLRYATATTDAGRWRGEAAIPWKILANAPAAGARPLLLRFNFAQHRAADCESATWAGPVDFGRDDRLTGILYVRDAARR